MAYNKTNGGPDFKPLLEAAGAVANETGKMIGVLKVVAGKHKDASAQTQLAVTAKSTTDAIKQVIQAAEGLTYGHKGTYSCFSDLMRHTGVRSPHHTHVTECKEAIEVIQRAIGDLDAAAISATVGLLEAPVGGPSNQQCKEELITLSRDLATATGKLVGSAKESPENLGPAAKETSVIVPNVVESAKRLAATTSDSETQQAQLQLAKNMIDAMLALVQNTRASSSNPYDKETQENLAASTRQVSSAITELVSSLKGGVMGLRQCDEAIAAVEAQLANLGKAAAGPKKSYAQAGDELTKQTRELVGGIGKINSVAKNDPENVGAVTQVVANVVPQLVVAINTAIASAADEEVKQKLLNGGKDVIIAARDAISAAKNVAADPKNSNAMSLLSQQQRQVTQSIGNLLNAVRLAHTRHPRHTLTRCAIYRFVRVPCWSVMPSTPRPASRRPSPSSTLRRSLPPPPPVSSRWSSPPARTSTRARPPSPPASVPPSTRSTTSPSTPLYLHVFNCFVFLTCPTTLIGRPTRRARRRRWARPTAISPTRSRRWARTPRTWPRCWATWWPSRTCSRPARPSRSPRRPACWPARRP
jgi:hypothetical protein